MAIRAEMLDGAVARLQLADDAGARIDGWTGKRVFDVVSALILLVVTLPLLVLAALAVKVTSRGPVFFVQHRTGRGGRPFPMLKFRTMHTDAEQRLGCEDALRLAYLTGSHKIPTRLDPRVTRIGRFLRMSSIDELPQLLNVLAGHMSLVGPRPVTAEQLPEYEDRLRDYLAVRPGLTGLWQVSGRNLVKFPERAELDTRYRAGCGPWLDLCIIARTPKAVLLRRGSE